MKFFLIKESLTPSDDYLYVEQHDEYYPKGHFFQTTPRHAFTIDDIEIQEYENGGGIKCHTLNLFGLIKNLMTNESNKYIGYMDTSSLSEDDDEVGVFFKFYIDDYEYDHKGWQSYWITPHNVKLMKDHPHFDKLSIDS